MSERAGVDTPFFVMRLEKNVLQTFWRMGIGQSQKRMIDAEQIATCA
jgi:hypothetical protein